MGSRHANVANLDEVAAEEGPRAGAYRSLMRPLGRTVGAAKIGCTFYEIEPGAVAFPFHWHAHNEEALIIVSGTGTLRIGQQSIAVRAGDYVAHLVGEENAHQLLNTGADTLRYYALSTKLSPEIAGYPDSGKIGVAMMSADGKFSRRLVDTSLPQPAYFDGDPLAQDGAKIQ